MASGAAEDQESVLRNAVRLCLKLAGAPDSPGVEQQISDNVIAAYAAVLVGCLCKGNEVRAVGGVNIS